MCCPCSSCGCSFVDHSILEVYAQDVFALTTRVYPEYALQPAVHVARSSQLSLMAFSATSLRTVQNLATPASHALLPWWGWALVGVGVVSALACFCAVACQPDAAAGIRGDDIDGDIDASAVPPWKRGRRRRTGLRAALHGWCRCCTRGGLGAGARAASGDYMDVDSPSLTM